MHNAFDTKEFRLPEFAEYLLRKQLTKEQHARFYVFWVRKFLENNGPDSNLTLTERLDHYLRDSGASVISFGVRRLDAAFPL